MPMKYCSSLFTKYGIFTLLYLKEISFTRMELNKRWEMFVFSGYLLNRCCKNEKFNIKVYIWNKCLKVSVMPLKEGFDAHMYNGMFLNELTHANVVCVMLNNTQDEPWSVKSNSQNWHLIRCTCVRAIIKIISKCLLSSSKDFIPYKLSKAIKNL